MARSKLKLLKAEDGYYLTGVEPFTVDGEAFDSQGPYENRKEALEARDRLDAFYEECKADGIDIEIRRRKADTQLPGIVHSDFRGEESVQLPDNEDSGGARQED